MNSSASSASSQRSNWAGAKTEESAVAMCSVVAGVQFNPKDNQDALRQKLIATLGAAAGRLEKVPKQFDASVECAFWGARADPC